MSTRMADGKFWWEQEPAEMTEIALQGDEGPLNELGERCSWPWDPQQLIGAPLGQYHCPYCGGMQVAGTRHMDWEGEDVAE